jgi:stage II sporulation protein D
MQLRYCMDQWVNAEGRMRRATFLGGLAGAYLTFGVGKAGLASEGLDLDTPEQNVAMRIFLPGESSGRYRGTLANIELPSGHSGTLNTVALEEYLYGVVPVEMPSSWPYSALEAQAILARTFAMKRRNPSHAYDVVAGSADQEYHGLEAETALSNAAVDASAGMVVLYNGQLASISYMSCCGGHTDSSERVWGTDYPYLQGVACAFCADAPNRNWSVRIPWARFANESGASGELQRVALDELAAGGRPGSLVFIASNGQGKISTGRMRELSGWTLPSSFIHSVTIERNGVPIAQNSALPAPQVTATPIVAAPTASPALVQVMRDDGDDLNDGSSGGGGSAPRRNRATSDDASTTLLIQGSGSGHGVGMCQWGARGMAMAGYTGQQIVAYYLPTTRLGAASDFS